jgi:hypothetical protein
LSFHGKFETVEDMSKGVESHNWSLSTLDSKDDFGLDVGAMFSIVLQHSNIHIANLENMKNLKNMGQKEYLMDYASWIFCCYCAHFFSSPSSPWNTALSLGKYGHIYVL